MINWILSATIVTFVFYVVVLSKSSSLQTTINHAYTHTATWYTLCYWHNCCPFWPIMFLNGTCKMAYGPWKRWSRFEKRSESNQYQPSMCQCATGLLQQLFKHHSPIWKFPVVTMMIHVLFLIYCYEENRKLTSNTSWTCLQVWDLSLVNIPHNVEISYCKKLNNITNGYPEKDTNTKIS